LLLFLLKKSNQKSSPLQRRPSSRTSFSSKIPASTDFFRPALMQRGNLNPGSSGTLLAVDQGELIECHNKILTYTLRPGQEACSIIDVTE